VSDSEVRPVAAVNRVRQGLVELLLVAGLYVAYTFSRMLADQDVGSALGHARDLLHLEDALGLAREHAVNAWFTAHDTVGVLASFWYSAAHYVVTVAALVWLYRRGRETYVPARRALAVATVIGLSFYLLMPTAPPRMLGGYVDVLSRHADVGWWGADASAPKGLGGLTNELAAFPSLHAGWSLWVALAVTAATASWALRGLAWAHAAITAVVVVGTANHWTVDVLVGWVVAVVGWLLAPVLARSVAAALAWLGGRAELPCRTRRLAAGARSATTAAGSAAANAAAVASEAIQQAGLVVPGRAVPPVAVRRLRQASALDDVWSP